MLDKSAAVTAAARHRDPRRERRATRPASAISRSTISSRPRGAGFRNSSTAISPAAPRPTPRCATTEKPSTNTVLCRACSTTSPAATRPRRCSARRYASPFGIPPMGSSALCAYRGDIVLTRGGGRSQRADDPQRLVADHAGGRARAKTTPPGIRPISPACRSASSRWSTASRPPATTPSSSPPTCRCRPTARTTSATAFRCRWRSRRASPGTR